MEDTMELSNKNSPTLIMRITIKIFVTSELSKITIKEFSVLDTGTHLILSISRRCFSFYIIISPFL